MLFEVEKNHRKPRVEKSNKEKLLLLSKYAACDSKKLRIICGRCYRIIKVGTSKKKGPSLTFQTKLC